MAEDIAFWINAFIPLPVYQGLSQLTLMIFSAFLARHYTVKVVEALKIK